MKTNLMIACMLCVIDAADMAVRHLRDALWLSVVAVIIAVGWGIILSMLWRHYDVVEK